MDNKRKMRVRKKRRMKRKAIHVLLLLLLLLLRRRGGGRGGARGGGKIINTASIASRQGFDNVAPYCASKWAVVSLTQSGARDLAKHNITVSGGAPGVVAP